MENFSHQDMFGWGWEKKRRKSCEDHKSSAKLTLFVWWFTTAQLYPLHFWRSETWNSFSSVYSLSPSSRSAFLHLLVPVILPPYGQYSIFKSLCPIFTSLPLSIWGKYSSAYFGEDPHDYIQNLPACPGSSPISRGLITSAELLSPIRWHLQLPGRMMGHLWDHSSAEHSSLLTSQYQPTNYFLIIFINEYILSKTPS